MLVLWRVIVVSAEYGNMTDSWLAILAYNVTVTFTMVPALLQMLRPVCCRAFIQSICAAMSPPGLIQHLPCYSNNDCYALILQYIGESFASKRGSCEEAQESLICQSWNSIVGIMWQVSPLRLERETCSLRLGMSG